jgi:Tfp pilus assembly protein PilF
MILFTLGIMRTLLLTMLVLSLAARCHGQVDALGEQLQEGIQLHDRGDYTGAIAKYDAIIAANSRYFAAYAEKALSLYQAARYQECVDVCKQALKDFPGDPRNDNLYVSYGSALDGLGKPEEAIKVYKEGIKKFPNYYLLPFNKGMTEYEHKQNEEAIKDYESAIGINHLHASSHQFLAYAIYPTNKMASAMALTTFLLIEPMGERAEKNLKILLQILGANVKKTDDKNITISIPSSSLDTKSKNPDDFGTTELMMSMTTAAGFSEKNKDSTVVGALRSKLSVLGLATPNKKGFFTNTYVVLLSDLDKAGMLETAAHLIYESAKDQDNQQWLQDNREKVEALNAWLKEHLQGRASG